jgi:phosphoglycolate phosphatase
MNGATIIFDLDGAIVDTAPDLLHATNHVLERHGLPPVDASVIRPVVGSGARWMIEAALAANGHRANPSELNDYVDEFVVYYSDNIAVSSRPYPGLEDALSSLKERGARLGVCTNKRTALARKLLAELNLAPYFEAVVGGDSLAVRKPNPEHLLQTIREVGGDQETAIMVGDSGVDIEAARAAGTPVIGVSFGYSPAPIEELRPDRVIHHFSELETAAASLL